LPAKESAISGCLKIGTEATPISNKGKGAGFNCGKKKKGGLGFVVCRKNEKDPLGGVLGAGGGKAPL